MSRTSLDLIDSEVYEVELVYSWTLVRERYAQGWRCVAAYRDDDDVAYVLERPVR